MVGRARVQAAVGKRAGRWVVCVSFLASLSLSLLTGAVASAQQGSISLNGEWLIQVGSEKLGAPPTNGWESTRIRIPSPFNANSFTNGHGPDFRSFPSYPDEWGTALSAWMRRTLTVPLQWTSGRVFLRFEAVNLHSVVYLDGGYLGENWDGYLPFEFDVTARVSPGGTYSLTVGVESPELHRVDGWRIPAPHGSFWGLHDSGVWQDVSLELRPDVRFQDLWVNTSVKDERVTAVLSIRNDRPAPVDVQIWCAARPESGGSSGKVWFGGAYRLAAGEVRAVTSSEVMIAPWLWSPEDPFLYRFQADLFIAEALVHQATRRFGFREFEIDGSRFLLNGVPVRLRGDAWHWMGIPYQNPEYARMWFQTAKDLNINTIRLHAQVYPSFYLDLADEMGLMIIDESAWWASGLDCLYSDEGWARLDDHVARLVIRDRSHPSVVLWSLANEVIAAARTGDLLGGTAGYLRGMGALKALVQSLDGSRPVYAEGDGDGFGLFDIVSFHYPGPQEASSLEAWRSYGKPVGAGEAGIMFYAAPPLVAWALGPGVYTSYEHHLAAVAFDLRRLLQNYRLWMDHVSPFNIPWYALEPLQFSGDPISWPDLSAPGIKPERIGPYTSGFNPGYDPDLPPCIPNPVFAAIRDEMIPVRLVTLDRTRQWFAGSPASREIYVINDLHRPAFLDLRFEELFGGGSRILREESLFIPPCEDRKIVVEWELPASSEVMAGTWTATLRESDSLVDRLDLPFVLVPPVLNASDLDTAEIAFYDPTGFPPVDILGVSNWRVLDSLDTIPEGVHLLLVGDQSGLQPSAAARLFEFLAGGGRAILCRGNEDILPDSVIERASYGTISGSNIYVNRSHSLSEVLAFDDLRWWSRDAIFTTAWRSFSMGNSRVLLAAGNGDAVVVDIPIGDGHLILDQANSGEADSETPGGLRFLVEMLRWAREVPPAAAERAAYFGPWGSDLHLFLHGIGMDLEVYAPTDAPGELGPIRCVNVDASNPSFADAIGAAWQSALAGLAGNGGTVVLWGLADDTVQRYRFLLPESPVLWTGNHPHLVTEGDTLARFIHPDTLYWIDGPEAGASIMKRGIVRTLTLEGREDHLVAAEFDWRALVNEGEPTRTSAILRSQREPHLKPVPLSALSSWRVGAGTLAVCQLRTDLFTRKNRQLAAAVLTNLGVRIHPLPPPPDLIPDYRVDWRDLFAFAAGWTGQAGEGASSPSLFGMRSAVDLLDFVRRWHEDLGRSTPAPGTSAAPTGKPLSSFDTRLTPEQFLLQRRTDADAAPGRTDEASPRP